ncbi:MAG TPA: hypothetical protein VIW29_07180 [Polyangiaceae bacterium]
MSLRACLLAALVVGGCYTQEGEAPPASAPKSGVPVQFAFGTIDGGEVSSDSTRGRTTALLFVTTYDLPSQAVALLLRDVLSKHKPLANGAIVMFEPPRSAPLVQVWRDQMQLELPVAMASPLLLAGESELGRVLGVPTLVVLDRRGRIALRLEGSFGREQIESSLSEADAAAPR